jgi:hypothetical protein
MPKETTPGRAVEPHVQHSGETVPAAVRAQILATEHWSLLGTRGTTWTGHGWSNQGQSSKNRGTPVREQYQTRSIPDRCRKP